MWLQQHNGCSHRMTRQDSVSVCCMLVARVLRVPRAVQCESYLAPSRRVRMRAKTEPGRGQYGTVDATDSRDATGADARPDAGAGTLPDLARTVPYGEPQGSELRPPARRVSSDSLCSGPPCVVEYWTIHWHPSRRRTQPSFTAGLGAAAIYGCPPLEALRRPTPATTQPSS